MRLLSQMSPPDGSYYDSNLQTYTPALQNHGASTAPSVVGRYMYLNDNMVWALAQFTFSGAGAGTTNLMITLPVAPNRTFRQVIPVHIGDAANGNSPNYNGYAVILAGQTGLQADRVRILAGSAAATAARWQNATGADLAYPSSNTLVVTMMGTYVI